MNEMELKFEQILGDIIRFLQTSKDRDSALFYICDTLKREIDHYDWVGFYLVDDSDKRMLYLGPYAGAATEHVRIPFGKGICGQAAEKRRTLVIQDVSAEGNYLSCSPIVKSEIVVPIFRGDELIGELDIDSHKLSPFTAADNRFTVKLCQLVAEHLFS
ncbi:GAF domain-containing protein [candidate division KSB1 bacterium]|nr:GAF domain-containing protein [candidate division KSB1 bacterium]